KGGASTWVLAGRNIQYDEGEMFFIPIKEDISPGTYRVDISLEQSGPGGAYLIFGRVNPGEPEQRQMFQKDLSNELFTPFAH
ncbi:hypothetical protein ACQZV8_02165, partial [Magnetococcales bacterium HHB-1]